MKKITIITDEIDRDFEGVNVVEKTIQNAIEALKEEGAKDVTYTIETEEILNPKS